MHPDLVAFGSVFFCGLALVPSGAHALELPNKIHLSKDEYFIAQKLYRGWQRVAPIVILALIFTGMLAMSKGTRSPASAIVSFVSIAATQGVFWTFTYPVNRKTSNWTRAPSDWELLRRKWEYSHAASAVLNLVAFGSAVLAIL